MARDVRARVIAFGAGLLGVLWLSGGTPARAALPDRPDATSLPVQRAEYAAARAHDRSPPLTLIRPVARKLEREEHEVKPLPRADSGASFDPVRQYTLPPPRMPTARSFEGVGEQFTGPAGPFVVNSAPPDTNGDVGLDHYVQTVNTDFAVFSKAGQITYGPVPINTLWSGFATGQPENACEQDNDGDAVVLYDAQADRWFVTQFAVSNPNPYYYQCVAVSVTGDPTGAYYRYAFSYNRFNDYGKFGVWPDGYYATYNMFSNTAALGTRICAFDRVRMLQGQPAAQQCVQLSNNYTGALPVDIDGRTPPPAGSPGYIVGLAANNPNQLLLWRYHLDWSTPANSAVTGPVPLPVAASPSPGHITQPGTDQRLSLLNDRLMFRLAYRNFGDHESLVVNQSVGTSDGTAGIRWYELRDPNGSVNIYQQGTYAPGDGNYRWMASAAMDQVGNIGMGFSVSGGTTFPSLAYTGRLVSDPLGQMTQGESLLISGGGSQQVDLERWGDYSSMSVDPADECTFWYTSEYIAANGTFNWRTRIGSFRFDNCPPNDFTLTAPGPQTVPPGGSVTAAVTTASARGSAESIDLSVDNLPPGVHGSFNPATVTAGGSSTLTLTADATLAVTTNAPYRITAVSASTRHTANGTLTVPGNDFSITLDPPFPAITEGKTATVTVRTQALSGPAEPMTLSLGSLPTGITGQLSTQTITAGETATLTLAVATGTDATRPNPLLVTGTSASASHAAEGTVATIQLPKAQMALPDPAVPIVAKGSIRARLFISPGTNLDHIDYFVDDVLVGTMDNNRTAYVWDSTQSRNGPHSFSAKAYDTAGNVAVADAITANVKNALPSPTVSLTSPADGDTVKGEVTISAEGSVASLTGFDRMELYVDDGLVGQSTSSPVTATWDTKTAKEGAHAVVAKIYDTDGKVGVTTANVTVKNTACGCGAAGDGSSLLGLALGAVLLASRRRLLRAR